MRIAPLGIFGTQLPDDQLDRHSMEDAALTHPHPACLQANVIFVRLIAAAINGLTDRQELYRMALIIADSFNEKTVIKEAVYRAVKGQVRDATDQMGWVAIALQNALWQLLYAPDFESGVMDTILQGGDTDTNAAICGALLGAVEGLEAIPPRWQKTVLGCKPQRGDPGVFRPRPTEYWPVDALDLARRLKGER
jgi:ADP-ribosylglycohydrolase